MDERDIRILKTITERGTDSPDVIHEETDIPKSTIYYRLNNLREQGIIENDLYDLDLEKLGLDITIIVEVIAEYEQEYHEQVGQRLSEVEGVSQVHFTMGERDFVVIAHVPDRKEVERLISDFEEIDMIHRTQSKFTITTIKNDPHILNSYSHETLTEILTDRRSDDDAEDESET